MRRPKERASSTNATEWQWHRAFVEKNQERLWVLTGAHHVAWCIEQHKKRLSASKTEVVFQACSQFQHQVSTLRFSLSPLQLSSSLWRRNHQKNGLKWESSRRRIVMDNSSYMNWEEKPWSYSILISSGWILYKMPLSRSVRQYLKSSQLESFRKMCFFLLVTFPFPLFSAFLLAYTSLFKFVEILMSHSKSVDIF